GTFKQRLPAQSAGTRIEYYFEVRGTKGGQAITQTLPESNPQAAPLELRVTPSSERQPPTPNTRSATATSLVGYSLQMVDISEQVTRTFELTRSQAVDQDYYPSGNLAAGLRESDFDPDAQIQHVVLGQGPFQRFRIPVTCAFDFAQHHIRQVDVTIRYGARAGSDEPLHTITVTLNAETPRQIVTFPADEAGSQSYDYTVDFVVDPNRTIGVAPGESISSSVTGFGDRAITVDLDAHLPLMPVEVVPGFLSFDSGMLREVQVRLESPANSEGQIVKLAPNVQLGGKEATYYLKPAAGTRSYNVVREFFYRHDRVSVRSDGLTDEKLVVNEPDEAVFRIEPHLIDRFNLVRKVFLDCEYSHADGSVDRATLHLINPAAQQPGGVGAGAGAGAGGSGDRDRSVFAVLLAPGDGRLWRATPRLVLADGAPLEAPTQTYSGASEPIISLEGLGYRVVGVDVLNASFVMQGSGAEQVVAIMAIFTAPTPGGGQDTGQVILRGQESKGFTILRNAAADAEVTVNLRVIRADGQTQTSGPHTLAGSEESAPEVPYVDIYRDHAEPDKFYLLSGLPRIATNAETGEPMFSFHMFARNIEMALASAGEGPVEYQLGQMYATVDLTIPPDDQAKIMDFLRALLRRESREGSGYRDLIGARGRFTEPRIATPYWESGTVQLNILDGLGPTFTKASIGQSTPSLTGYNQATVWATLGTEGAQLLWETLRGNLEPASGDGALPIQAAVQYSLKGWARVPALNVSVEADSEVVYEELRKRTRIKETSGNKTWTYPQIKELTKELEASDVIEIVWDDWAPPDGDKQEIQSQITTQMLNMVSNQIANSFFQPAAVSGPELEELGATFTHSREGGVQGSLLWLDEFEHSVTRHIGFSLKQSTNTSFLHTPQTSMMSALTPQQVERHVRLIPLDSPEVRILEVPVNANADFERDGIASIDFEITYDQFDEATDRQIKQVMAERFTKGDETFVFRTRMARDRNGRLLDSYDVKAKLVYFASTESPEPIEYKDISDRQLTLSYDRLGYLRVSVQAGDIDWTKIESVFVDLDYQGARASANDAVVKLTEAENTGVWQTPRRGSLTRHYSYTVKYKYKDGNELTTRPQRSDSETLVIHDNLASSLRRFFNVIVDPNSVENVILRIRYDGGGGAPVEIARDFNQTESWEYIQSVAEGAPREFIYSYIIQFKDGHITESEDITVGEDDDVEPIHARRYPMDIFIDGGGLDWTQWRLATVQITYHDPEFNFTDSKSADRITRDSNFTTVPLELFHPSRRTYSYEVNLVPQPGQGPRTPRAMAGTAKIGAALQLKELGPVAQLKKLQLVPERDPFNIAFAAFNKQIALSGNVPQLERTPSSDGRSYAVEGRSKRYSRPALRLAQRGGWEPGPEVRFVRAEDGSLRLAVAFEEDPDAEHRADGALPFAVKVTSVALEPADGSGAWSRLAFDQTLLQIPLGQGDDGPAFRIEAEALLPNEGEATQIASALQRDGGARWKIALEFDWVPKQIRRSSNRSGRSTGFVATPILLHRAPVVTAQPMVAARARVDRTSLNSSAVLRLVKEARVTPQPRGGRGGSGDRPQTATAMPAGGLKRVKLNGVIDKIVAGQIETPVLDTQPDNDVRTQRIVRSIAAHYPPQFPAHEPIYAALTGAGSHLGWRASAHGLFQPADLRDTCYILPDRFLLARNAESTLPEVTGILLEPQEIPSGTSLEDALITRLTFRVVPYIDPARLVELRKLIRAETSNEVVYSDLTIGGYKSARFVPDQALQGLGEFLTGAREAESREVTPEAGFAITYEGRAEFTSLLFDKLRGEGIRGEVEFELEQQSGDLLRQRVPVLLALDDTAPLEPTWSFAFADPQDPGSQRVLEITNPYARELEVDALTLTALSRSTVTGEILDFRHADLGRDNLRLQPGTTETVGLDFGADDAAWNVYELVFGDVALDVDPQQSLQALYDTFVNTVRSWKITVTAPQFVGFDHLPDEMQQHVAQILTFEVELRRPGLSRTVSARVSRDTPEAEVFLDRRLADLLKESSETAYEYRRRIVRFTSATAWSDWQTTTDASLILFSTPEQDFLIPLRPGHAVGRGWTAATERRPMGVTWHWTAGSTLAGCRATLGGESPAQKGVASAHYGIGRSFAEGIDRYVALDNRSWHAGKNQTLRWDGQPSTNATKGARATIGIETVNVGFGRPGVAHGDDWLLATTPNGKHVRQVQPWTDEQLEMCIQIGKEVVARWPHIRPEDHHGHHDLCPGYKEDVIGFPFARVLRGIYDDPGIVDVWTPFRLPAQRQRALVTLGYDLGPLGPAGDGVDGDWGRLSDAALLAFQAERGLVDDGMWTSFVCRAMDAALRAAGHDPLQLAAAEDAKLAQHPGGPTESAKREPLAMSGLKRAATLLLLLLAPLGPIAGPAAAQEVVARIDAVSGTAHVARADTRLIAEAGLELHRRDTLETAEDGRLRLNFRDGTVIALGPGSRARVQHYLDTLGGADSRPPLVELVVGILRATVPNVGSLGWSVQTRAAVASSRSTDWIIEHRADKTALIVLGGEVEVIGDAGGRLLLTGGEGVDVSRGTPLPAAPSRWGAQRVIAFVERVEMP
ncbi:unnamed protein product, partial [Symbiodinium pilosum]